jgi:hypothetical protein
MIAVLPLAQGEFLLSCSAVPVFSSFGVIIMAIPEKRQSVS